MRATLCPSNEVIGAGHTRVVQERRHATSWAAEEEGVRYEQGRPGYPERIVPLLAEHLSLGPGRWVADVAAGTGKLTRLLGATGARVLAVEPMPGMRARLRELPGPLVVAGTAERLPLRDGVLQAVTVAQAFHWFPLPAAALELRRVVAPEGRLAIVTNVRDPDWTEMEQVGDILARYEALGPRPESVGTWREALAASGTWRRVQRLELPNEQTFATWEDFDARYASISFAILLPASDRDAMLAELRSTVPGTLPVVIPLRTLVEVWEPVPGGELSRPGR